MQYFYYKLKLHLIVVTELSSKLNINFYDYKNSKGMKLIFYSTPHHLDSLIDSKNTDSTNNIKKECPASFLKVLGEPLILTNISMARKKLNLDKVLIPKGLHNALRIVQEAFPQIDVEEFSDGIYDRCDNDNNNDSERKRSIAASSQHPLYSKVVIGGKYEDFEIPLNACLHYSENIEGLFMESIIYPWDFLNLVQKVLHDPIVITFRRKKIHGIQLIQAAESISLVGTPEHIRMVLNKYVDLGLTHFVLDLVGLDQSTIKLVDSKIIKKL